MNRVSLFPTAMLLAFCVSGCDTDDVGKLCNAQTGSIGLSPIDGENPVVEVVRIHRDENCQSFQCLTHLGLAPHCTRTCQLVASEVPCNTASDCADAATCADGFCQLDACPPGFACEAPFSVGEWANQRMCVRKIDCQSNLECEGLGTIDCISLGCFDQCLANEDCDMHQLQCEPLSELQCVCDNETADCNAADLRCSPESIPGGLPVGSIATRSACLLREPPQ